MRVGDAGDYADDGARADGEHHGAKADGGARVDCVGMLCAK